MKPDANDPVDVFVRRADDVLREWSQAPATRHLRLAGVEFLRAMRCGLDDAITALDPKHDKREAPRPTDLPADPPAESS